MTIDELRDGIAAQMALAYEELEWLVRIPSVGFPDFDPANVRASAEVTASILSGAGLGDVRLIEIPGGHPAVFGEIAAPPGMPTLLLYAHHDVQPEGPHDQWDTPPFEPAIRDGRMFGRGTSDDKCGIVMHAAALRAFGGRPPVGVKVIVEGEEEATAEHLPFLIGEHVEMLRADCVVIADSGVWRRGVPALTTSIRGVVAVSVKVRVAERALHSGVYGSAVPDAITALARMIASLHDERGNVAVPGLRRYAEPGPDYAEEEFRAETAVPPGLELIGDGELIDRLWRGPSISVVGFDAPRIAEASFQVVPVARALVTMRIAPGEDPHEALNALIKHLEAATPWGVDVSFESEERARGHETTKQGRFFEAAQRSLRDAWGTDPVDMGMGGSVPLVPLLADALPDADILMTGPGDEDSGAHSTNESVDLVELERACLAEALFMAYLAES